ncbi:prominin-2 [Astatotilapia calliptera]|uniref:Prominin 2 n=1 Tax=Astatotilapia calliptera TaxID=8154 RepID=A0AAX7TY20_ASTCA|nr:prominin-1-A-like [Astatotilapia calliptera]
MGLYGNMRNLCGVVGVVLLGLSLTQPVLSQTSCKADVAPQNFTQPHYHNTAKNNSKTGFMSAIVQSFLHTVEPNAFSSDLVVTVVKEFQRGLPDQATIKEILVHKVGFLVCIAIGILYIVLMPIVGFFLACCRCCGNCGGKMYQEQSSSIHRCRKTLYWCAFATTIIILAGNVCMFRSNEAFKVSVDKGPGELINTIENINTFFTNVPEQINSVVDKSNKTVDEVKKNLKDIGIQLGSAIQSKFNGTLHRALRSVKLLDQEIQNTSRQLKTLNSSLVQLQSSADRVQANITAVKNSINQTLSDSRCQNCTTLSQVLQSLTVDTTIDTRGLSKFQSAVDKANQADLTSQINKVEEYFQNIPQTVNNETNNIVQSSTKQLDSIQAQISQFKNYFPVSALTDVSRTLNTTQTEIKNILPQINNAEFIRWSVCVTLCCVVLLVVVCNVLGLVLGPLGLKPKEDPMKRSCTANCGGIFLMMSAGFSFLFSWLFMIVVIILFLVGENVYTLVCRPWNNGQLLKLVDSSGLIPLPQITLSSGMKMNISISDIYRNCEENQALWTALNLSQIIDLGNLLNVSKYTGSVQQDFENTNISLPSVAFLSDDIKNQLQDISTEAKKFDFTAIMQQMNAISSINLNTTANNLNSLADAQPDPDIKQQFKNEANIVRMIQADIDTNIKPQLTNVNSSLKGLQTTTDKVNGTVEEVLSNVQAAQDFLKTNATRIVKNESKTFLDCQLHYFIAYTDWAKLMITQQVGRCGPVAGALDSVDVIVCAYMVESLNAFWFSLGWCIMFFIPSIIFSIKLAKYYRRMKESDFFENHITVNQIPRAQMKQ